MSVRRVVGARELKRRHSANPIEVVDLGIELVEHPGAVHPPLDVFAPIDTGRTDVLAQGEGHGPTRAVDLIGDLCAACRGADDKHATLLKLLRVAVLLRRERRN